MKSKFLFLLIGLVLFLVACQERQPEVPQAPQPVPQETPETPAAEVPQVDMDNGGDEQEVESGLDKTFGPVEENEVITLDDVRCDAATRTVHFRFRNPDDKSWQLNQELPFPAPPDLASVRITVNSYEVNGRAEYRENGELLFGSGKFSQKCNGIEVLAPGETATCTLSPVPLKSATGVAAGVNEIFINSAGSDGRVRFTCE